MNQWFQEFDKVSNWPIYTIDDRLATDYILRFESFAPGLQELSDMLEIEVILPDYKAKSGFRSDLRRLCARRGVGYGLPIRRHRRRTQSKHRVDG